MDTSVHAIAQQALADEFKKIIAQYPHMRLESIDVKDSGLPFLADKIAPRMRTDINNPQVQAWSQAVSDADAFVLIAPEYNNGYTALLKNALDSLYAPWNNKPVGLVACMLHEQAQSSFIAMMRAITQELQMIPVGTAVVIDALSTANSLAVNEIILKKCTTMINQLHSSQPGGMVNRVKQWFIRYGLQSLFFITNKAHSFFSAVWGSSIKNNALPVLHTKKEKPFLIKIILASTREGRMSPVVGNAVAAIINKRSDVHAEILDLKEYNLPLFADSTIDKRINADVVLAQWKTDVSSADGYIVVVPEYNRAYPGVLKNALDLLDKQLCDKPVAYVGYAGGPAGGKNAIQYLKAVMRTFNMRIVEQALYTAFMEKC